MPGPTRERRWTLDESRRKDATRGMTHQGENMAEVVVTPAVRVPSEERRYVGRAWYILSSLAATLCSALVVGSAVQNVDELFGYVPPLFLLLLPTAGLGIGIMLVD